MAAPSAPDRSDPGARWRIQLAIGALFGGVLLSILLGGALIAAGGWDFDVSSSPGADFGRVVGQAGRGETLDHNRIPLIVQVVANTPLWATFLGVPLVARRQGLDWRRDLGWSMRAVDAPMGLAIGVATQFALVPLYYVVLPFIDAEELERPARELIAGATTPAAVAALIFFTVLAAPVCEEVLYRGMLFRGILGMESGRRWALVLAVTVSSAIFAASHLQVVQFPGLMLIGVVAALAFHRTGRLGTAIWIHAGFNATTVAILLPEIY